MKYQVMPDLTPLEYEALKADIQERGVLVPVEVDEAGDLLDGHHRVRAWTELRAEGVTLPNYPKLVRTGLNEEQKRNHARSLNVLRRQLSKEQRAEVMRSMRSDGATYQEIAKATGVSVDTAHRVARGAELSDFGKVTGADGKNYPASYQKHEPLSPMQTLFVPGEAVVLDPHAAKRQVDEAREEKREERRTEREAMHAAKAQPGALHGRYQVLYVDPPWRYEHSETDSRKIENQYPTMELDAICALPVADIAENDAVLFLWATSPKLAEAMRVIETWGFTYRTCMVWDKERMGMGYYARQQHELLLIAAVGALPVPEPQNRPASVVRLRRDNEHSRKPNEFYELIECMYPNRTKVELFARNQRDGWAAWGNEPE